MSASVKSGAIFTSSGGGPRASHFIPSRVCQERAPGGRAGAVEGRAEMEGRAPSAGAGGGPAGAASKQAHPTGVRRRDAGLQAGRLAPARQHRLVASLPAHQKVGLDAQGGR